MTIGKSDILKVRRTSADEAFARVLRDAVETVERAGIPFLVLGGLASSLVGRPRWTHDIDFLVRPDDARDVLEVLRGAGQPVIRHAYNIYTLDAGRQVLPAAAGGIS